MVKYKVYSRGSDGCPLLRPNGTSPKPKCSHVSPNRHLLCDAHSPVLISDPDLKSPYRTYYVDVGSVGGLEDNKIWTLEMSPQTDTNDNQKQTQNTPIVLVHGFASGIGLYSTGRSSEVNLLTVMSIRSMGVQLGLTLSDKPTDLCFRCVRICQKLATACPSPVQHLRARLDRQYRAVANQCRSQPEVYTFGTLFRRLLKRCLRPQISRAGGASGHGRPVGNAHYGHAEAAEPAQAGATLVGAHHSQDHHLIHAIGRPESGRSLWADRCSPFPTRYSREVRERVWRRQWPPLLGLHLPLQRPVSAHRRDVFPATVDQTRVG